MAVSFITVWVSATGGGAVNVRGPAGSVNRMHGSSEDARRSVRTQRLRELSHVRCLSDRGIGHEPSRLNALRDEDDSLIVFTRARRLDGMSWPGAQYWQLAPGVPEFDYLPNERVSARPAWQR